MALVVLLHLGLLLYFAPPEVMLSRDPVATIDYSLHFHQVDRFLRAMRGFGRMWSYDPQMLAGHPAGALEDLTSKGLELFVYVLTGLGVHPGLAFNLFILLVHLLLPLLAYLSAWLLGLSPVQRALTALFWVVLWFFDSFVHWIWFCGMISWALSSMLAMVLLGLVYRALERGQKGAWLAAAPLATLLVTVHPMAGVVASLPCAVLYLRRIRRLGLWHHLGVLLTAAAPLAVSLIWFGTAFRFWHLLMDPTTFLQPDPTYILWDFLDIMKETWNTGGAPVRTVFRVLCLALAAVGLWRWRRERDPRLLPLGLLLGAMLLLSYAGNFLAATRQLQPLRHLVPALLAASLPAAVALSELLSRDRIRSMSSAARTLLVIALLLILPRMARTVLVNMPEPLPTGTKLPPSSGPMDKHQEALTGLPCAPPVGLRHHGTYIPHLDVVRWLKAHHRGRGRVLVQDWILGEHLAWATDIPILGGFEQRIIPHADAHLFRHHPFGDPPGPALRDYLVRYAVGYVVVRALLPVLEWRKDLLQFRVLLSGVPGYRVYETRIQPSYFMEGSGRIVRQSLNSIMVDKARGKRLVLRFHWMPTLRCRPGCRVERAPLPGDGVGFCAIPDPPSRFEVYNAYLFDERGP